MFLVSVKPHGRTLRSLMCLVCATECVETHTISDGLGELYGRGIADLRM